MLHSLLTDSESKHDRKLPGETKEIKIGPFLKNPVKVYQLYRCTAQYEIFFCISGKILFRTVVY